VSDETTTPTTLVPNVRGARTVFGQPVREGGGGAPDSDGFYRMPGFCSFGPPRFVLGADTSAPFAPPDSDPITTGRAPRIYFTFNLTPAHDEDVRACLYELIDLGMVDDSTALKVSERLGGYVVDPGGIVCPDWAGVLAAVRKLWGLA